MFIKFGSTNWNWQTSITISSGDVTGEQSQVNVQTNTKVLNW